MTTTLVRPSGATSPPAANHAPAMPEHIASMPDADFIGLMLAWKADAAAGITPWTDAEMVQHWLATCSRTGSPNTVAAYRRDLDLFRQHLGGDSLAPGDPQAITAWVVAMRGQVDAGTTSARTVNRRLNTVSAFYKWAADPLRRVRTGIATTPVPRRLALQTPAAPPVPLQAEQLYRLLNAAHSRRDELILRIIYLLGTRASELINIRRDDIRRTDSGAVVTIRKGKGSKSRSIPINDTVLATIDDLLALAGDSPWLVPGRDPAAPMCRQTLGRIVRRAGAAAGIDAWPHLLRHTHAGHAHARTKDLKLVSTTLGHSSTAITADLYLHASTTDSSANHLVA